MQPALCLGPPLYKSLPPHQSVPSPAEPCEAHCSQKQKHWDMEPSLLGHRLFCYVLPARSAWISLSQRCSPRSCTEGLAGLCTIRGCPSSLEHAALCEELKVGKAAAADLTSQSISEVTAETVRHQGSALLLRTEQKSPNNHHTHSETLFREMLSVHALVILPKRCAFLFLSPWEALLNLWFSNLACLLSLRQLVSSTGHITPCRAQHFCPTKSKPMLRGLASSWPPQGHCCLLLIFWGEAVCYITHWEPPEPRWAAACQHIYLFRFYFSSELPVAMATQEALIGLHVYKQPLQISLPSLSPEVICIVINS